MNHLMFDVDGTLVKSYEFDERLFLDSVREITGVEVRNNWQTYPHVTDCRILKTFIDRQSPNIALSELENSVKPLFISKVKEYLESHPAKEINGAIDFIHSIRAREDIVLSIATGGWGETAISKLESAGFKINDKPLGKQRLSPHYEIIVIQSA